MKRFIISSLLGAILLVNLPQTAWGQVGITAVPFLQINNHARSMGLAESNIALKNDLSGIHLNPATFGRSNTIQLSTQLHGTDPGFSGGTAWLPNYNTDLNVWSPLLIIGFEHFSIGYQHTYLDLGQQTQTDEEGNVIGTFSTYEKANTIALSVDLHDYISVGAGITYFESKLVPSGTMVGNQEVTAPEGTSYDLGLYGEYPFHTKHVIIKPSVGWSLTDYGDPISYTLTEDPLPMMMRGGVGLRLTTTEQIRGRHVLSIGYYESRSKIIARLNDKGEPMEPWEALFNSWDSYTRHNGQELVTLSPKDQLMHQSGFEFMFWEIVSVQFGHYYEHPENGAREYDTVGFGIHHKYFSLHFAEMYLEDEDHPLSNTAFAQITSTIPLDKIPDIIRIR